MWLQYVRRILNSTLLLRFLFAIKGSGCCDACSTKTGPAVSSLGADSDYLLMNENITKNIKYSSESQLF